MKLSKLPGFKKKSNRSSSSCRWLQEHFSDPYVRKAQAVGYRSRAVYKLMDLQRRDHLFLRGNRIIELGAAPGSWSQYLVSLTGPKGWILALDRLPMEPVSGVEFIQGDFTDQRVVEQIRKKYQAKLLSVDWVVSDMAPEFSGIDAIDIPGSIVLAELAFEFALEVLNPAGGFLIKLFQGEGFDAYIRDLRSSFRRVMIRKPPASRSRSREIYVIAKNLLKKTASGMIDK